jgi:nucleoside-diphosphate-sugar epimerase
VLVGKSAGVVVGITGAGGYLGSALDASLRSSGVDVVQYRRSVPNSNDEDNVRYFELGQRPEPGTFEGVTCLVHTAWDLRETNPRRSWECNVEGSKRLLSAALDDGVQRFIFVSSMSAYFGTRQNYGVAKLAVERAVLEAQQLVVRPGLVYGGTPGGMVLTLSKLARLPVIPVFRNAKLFTAHIDDIIAALEKLVLQPEVPSDVLGLANESPTTFPTLMRALAVEVGSKSSTFPVPWHPLLFSLQVAEKVGVPLPVRSDSLLGLVRGPQIVPESAITAELGLEFRPFPEGLAGSFDPV